ncbi:hypothetical protein [uncultured Mitsuokella sp.]|uniref:hypothetical protein n=1 Tax=uncultured Mitsuokella sp. TaxID=453120 RepID=UPI00261786AB|nr:hypothetical protein [uncultured Mitsuokella sp.]
MTAVLDSSPVIRYHKGEIACTAARCRSIGIQACGEGVEAEEEYELLTKHCHANSM